jgi:hypothetical protein
LVVIDGNYRNDNQNYNYNSLFVLKTDSKSAVISVNEAVLFVSSTNVLMLSLRSHNSQAPFYDETGALNLLDKATQKIINIENVAAF